MKKLEHLVTTENIEGKISKGMPANTKVIYSLSTCYGRSATEVLEPTHYNAGP